MALKHAELTEKIIGLCLQVFKELGYGYIESVYHRALVIALEEAGLKVESQVAIKVHFRGREVGTFVADLVVEGAVILELKSVAKLAPEHKAQLINYLKAAEMDVGLLVNFGAPRLDFQRLEHPDVYRERKGHSS
jgi:GxxExxY protein